MTAPPFALLYTAEARRVINDLGKPAHAAKLRKVKKTLRLLRDVGPSHPGLSSHKYHSITGPNGEDVWESHIENRTPGAWRIWWVYGPEADAITIVTIGPHP
ncbi:MAG: hypothetical protein M3Q30_26625 [Actinomycetota bacterium]|nr:hypothetical protein [Actinomycetota bacterium]